MSHKGDQGHINMTLVHKLYAVVRDWPPTQIHCCILIRQHLLCCDWECVLTVPSNILVIHIPEVEGYFHKNDLANPALWHPGMKSVTQSAIQRGQWTHPFVLVMSISPSKLTLLVERPMFKHTDTRRMHLGSLLTWHEILHKCPHRWSYGFTY